MMQSGLRLSPQILTRSIVALAAVLLVSGCSFFKGDDDPNPPAELERFKATLKVKKAWSKGIGDGADLLRLSLGPGSDGSIVVAAAHDGKIAAFEAAKGKKRWSVKTKLPLSGGAAVNNGVVAVGSISGTVVLLSAEDGSEIWRKDVASEVLAAPAIGNGLVIVRTVDGKLLALDQRDGEQVWLVQKSVPRLTLRGTSSPVISGQAVICGFDNGRLAAFDISDGDELWDVMLAPPSGRTEIERLIDLNSAPVVVGNDVFAVSYQGRLAGVAVGGGQSLWSVDVSSYAGIDADFSAVYVSTTDSKLAAFSSSSGRELWNSDVLLNRQISAPAKQAKSVVVGDFEGYLHWFDSLTGQLQARAKAGGDPISAAPLVSNDMLYVVNDGGKLVAFKITGTKGK